MKTLFKLFLVVATFIGCFHLTKVLNVNNPDICAIIWFMPAIMLGLGIVAFSTPLNDDDDC